MKSAQRCLQILSLITTSEAGRTFREIGDELDIPRSSLHGLLTTMVDSGWLNHDHETHTYWLGIRTLEAGNAYSRHLDIPGIAQSRMQQICDQTHETVQLSVLDGRHTVYIAKVDPPQALRLASAVGRRLPAHATGVGKVLLADLTDGELDLVLDGVTLESFTPSTLSDMDLLRRRLRQIQARGYATDNQEYTKGVRCVAVPIRDHRGRVAAAMSVSAPLVRFDRHLSDVALELLTSAAKDISSELGYRPSRD